MCEERANMYKYNCPNFWVLRLSLHLMRHRKCVIISKFNILRRDERMPLNVFQQKYLSLVVRCGGVPGRFLVLQSRRDSRQFSTMTDVFATSMCLNCGVRSSANFLYFFREGFILESPSWHLLGKANRYHPTAWHELEGERI